MTDNKTTYSNSRRTLSGRSFIRFAAKSFAVIILLSFFSGCYADGSRLSSLQRDRMERNARAEEEALIRNNDPQGSVRHERRQKRYRKKELRRLEALEEQRELDEELAAELWWIEKELMAIELASEHRKREDEEVKLWREEEKKEEEAEARRKAETITITIKETPKNVEQRVLGSLGMVYVEGGCFEVEERSSVNDTIEEEADKLECVKDFYMAQHEITTGEFMEFVRETNYKTDAERDGGCYLYTGNTWYKTSNWKTKNRYNWRNISFNQDIDHPVACVSWDDANEFVEWKSRKHGIKYRLPTEAEWEYAASGGDYREKWSGTNEEGDIGIYAWHSNNSDNRTHPVGQKKPNKLGLFDMSGNVWEWVQDNYDNSADSMVRTDSSLRVIRGGSWYSINRNLSTDKRFKHLQANYRDFASGFRLGMDGNIKLHKETNAGNGNVSTALD